MTLLKVAGKLWVVVSGVVLFDAAGDGDVAIVVAGETTEKVGNEEVGMAVTCACGDDGDEGEGEVKGVATFGVVVGVVTLLRPSKREGKFPLEVVDGDG